MRNLPQGPDFERPEGAGPKIGPYEPKAVAGPGPEPRPSVLGWLKRKLRRPRDDVSFEPPAGWKPGQFRWRKPTPSAKKRRRRRPDDFTWQDPS